MAWRDNIEKKQMFSARLLSMHRFHFLQRRKKANNTENQQGMFGFEDRSNNCAGWEQHDDYETIEFTPFFSPMPTEKLNQPTSTHCVLTVCSNRSGNKYGHGS